MRQTNQFSISTLLFILGSFNAALSEMSRFTIVSDIEMSRQNGTTYIKYNDSKYSFGVGECYNQVSTFAVDSLGYVINVTGTTLLNKTADFFTWGAKNLTVIFNTNLDLEGLTSYCVLDTTGSHANRSLTCDTEKAELAIIYNSAFPFRNGMIGFSFSGAQLIECSLGFDGFLVGGYKNSHIMPSPTTVSPTASPFTPSPSPSSSSNHDASGFNNLLLVPIIFGSIAAIGSGVAIALKYKKTCFSLTSRLFCSNRNKAENEHYEELASGDEKSCWGKFVSAASKLFCSTTTSRSSSSSITLAGVDTSLDTTLVV